MYEQYYYYAVFLLRTVGELIEAFWWQWCWIVYQYDVLFAMLMLICILLLAILIKIRTMKVITQEGTAIHDFVRAMRGEK